jgi:hypothetical protein
MINYIHKKELLRNIINAFIVSTDNECRRKPIRSLPELNRRSTSTSAAGIGR